MADITAHFTIYRGQHNGDLKHVSTVLRQSNFRDGLQLVKPKPFNENIFVMKKAKPTLKFLVPYKPLNNIELVPIVLTFFASNLILSKQENSSLNEMVKHFQEKMAWQKDWATLEEESFLSESKHFIKLVEKRITQTSHLSNKEGTYGGEHLLVTSFFYSPQDDEEYSVISYNTDLLNFHHKGLVSWKKDLKKFGEKLLKSICVSGNQ